MKLEKVIHREEERIKIDFPYSQENIKIVKQIPGARWSESMHAWHIPFSQDACNMVKTYFDEVEIPDEINFPLGTQHKENPKALETLSNNYVKRGVEIIQLSRKIIVKMPWNENDIQFVNSFKYSRWNKKEFVWELPNYEDTLDKLTKHFEGRILAFSMLNNIETATQKRGISKNEILCIKTHSGRIKIIGLYNKELLKEIKKFPFYSWDVVNKWWTIPYSEKFLVHLRKIVLQQNFRFQYEEETGDFSKKPKLTSDDVLNYRDCPKEYIDKLNELRYSKNTIRLYKSSFEEFINFYPRNDINRIDEPMIIAFIRYLVTDRKVSVSYQNVSINAIKFYYERVLGGQRKIYRIERPITEKTLK